MYKRANTPANIECLARGIVNNMTDKAIEKLAKNITDIGNMTIEDMKVVIVAEIKPYYFNDPELFQSDWNIHFNETDK